MKFIAMHTTATIKVTDGNDEQIIASARFMRSENTDKAIEFCKEQAARLNEIYTKFGQCDELADLMDEIEDALDRAKHAESRLQEIEF